MWSISFNISIGANAPKGVPDLSWNEFCSSFLPITTASLNGAALQFTPADVIVKPMGNGGKEYKSDLEITLKDAFGKKIFFNEKVICHNTPASLWSGQGEMKENVPCGFIISSYEPDVTLFPQKILYHLKIYI